MPIPDAVTNQEPKAAKQNRKQPLGGKHKDGGDESDMELLSDEEGKAVLDAAPLVSPPSSSSPSKAADGEQPEYIPIPATLGTATAGAGTGDGAVTAAAAAGTSEGVDEEGAGRRPPYWMSYCSTIKSPLLRLHQGVCVGGYRREGPIPVALLPSCPLALYSTR